MELLINMANVLYLLSYFVRDMLRLRLLTVVAACCLTTYFYLQPEPLMTAVYWNVGFIGLNLFRIVRDRKTESRARSGLLNKASPSDVGSGGAVELLGPKPSIALTDR